MPESSLAATANATANSTASPAAGTIALAILADFSASLPALGLALQAIGAALLMLFFLPCL
ncbi:hypothetical protein [Cupriavidus malaysiensis]|uniref:Uncharacterized protein n=1 Tax=Cupriavidus malaysiensis TaxID=367825 RepID=A0ABN4TXZ2_9BURK|nr:hypothetical protein [Cupriavidus malaysiensis]AOZ10455.1 hypothetical protein BKK80_33320 [Cupriavidus malaysiensis]